MTLSVDIGHRFGAFALDAAFEVPPGITALFGPSGSGKSTIANAVAGLFRPDRGRIASGGRVLFDSDRRVWLRPEDRAVGYVFQDARLFPHLSVVRNLVYGGRHDFDRIVEMLGLGDLLERRPGSLSGGERQRVALGRALMRDPEILLMDEPLSALDAPRKATVMPYLERLRDEVGLPILYVSHDVSEVARLASRIVVLDAGRVMRAGQLDAVLSDPGMVPYLGVQEAGAVLCAHVVEAAPDGLVRLALRAGELWLPGPLGPVGTEVRLRIPAGDVILAAERPEALSALNILPVTVIEVIQGRGPGVAVALACGEDRLLARVTKRSAEALGLTPGQAVYAVLKATAVAPRDIG